MENSILYQVVSYWTCWNDSYHITEGIYSTVELANECVEIITNREMNNRTVPCPIEGLCDVHDDITDDGMLKLLTLTEDEYIAYEVWSKLKTNAYKFVECKIYELELNQLPIKN